MSSVFCEGVYNLQLNTTQGEYVIDEFQYRLYITVKLFWWQNKKNYIKPNTNLIICILQKILMGGGGDWKTLIIK